MRIGERVADLMYYHRPRLTQAEMEDRTGFSQSTVSQWLRRADEEWDAETIQIFADALGVEVAVLRQRDPWIDALEQIGARVEDEAAADPETGQELLEAWRRVSARIADPAEYDATLPAPRPPGRRRRRRRVQS